MTAEEKRIRVNASARRYRVRHGDKLRERMREHQRRYRAAHPERYRVVALRSHHLDVARKLLNLARARAKKNGLLFAITLADIRVPDFCPVFGVRLVSGGGTGFQDASPTLDRLDNSKGYVPGNVAVISWRANRIKCDASIAEIRLLVAFLEQRVAGVFA